MKYSLRSLMVVVFLAALLSSAVAIFVRRHEVWSRAMECRASSRNGSRQMRSHKLVKFSIRDLLLVTVIVALAGQFDVGTWGGKR